ncbi:UNVERIFIED_CONTAM: hypothetical protein RMT77_013924 [Armadillidium vulgare]
MYGLNSKILSEAKIPKAKILFLFAMICESHYLKFSFLLLIIIIIRMLGIGKLALNFLFVEAGSQLMMLLDLFDLPHSDFVGHVTDPASLKGIKFVLQIFIFKIHITLISSKIKKIKIKNKNTFLEII